MPDDLDNPQRYRFSYIQTAEAWYANTSLPHGSDNARVVDSLNLTVVDEELHRLADFGVEWITFGGNDKQTHPQLCLFDDSWFTFELYAMQQFLTRLAALNPDEDDTSRPAVVAILRDCAWTDTTERVGPWSAQDDEPVPATLPAALADAYSGSHDWNAVAKAAVEHLNPKGTS